MGMALGIGLGLGGLVSLGGGVPSPQFPQYVFGANFADAPGKVPGFSYTRATVGAMVQQYDGSFVQPEIGEIPLRGGRRVQNLLTYSEDFSNAAWSKASGGVGATPVGVGDLVTVDGGGGSTASDQSIMSHAVTTVVGVTYTFVVRLAAERPEDVGKIIGLRSVDTGSYTLHTLTADEQTKSVTGVASSTSSFMHIGLRGTHGTSMGEVQFRAKAQLQTGSTASEYVSNGVESSPYHGFGVDGVKWFSTDADGLDLTDAGSGYPVRCTGMARRPAITNLHIYANPTAAQLSGSLTRTDEAGFLGLPRSIGIAGDAVSRYAYRSLSLTGDYTVQVVVKMDDLSEPRVTDTTVDASTDFSLSVAGSLVPAANISIAPIGQSCYLVSGYGAGVGSSGNYGFARFSTQSAKGFKAVLFQVVAGTVPQDFVLTNGTAVTVNAEAPALVPATIGASSDGVWVIESTQDADSDDQVILAAAGAAGESWSIGATHTVVDGSVTQASIADSWSAGTLIHAVRIEADDVSVDLDGVSVGTDTSATMPTITSITLGGGSTGMGFRRIYYFDPATITDSEKLSLSAGDLPTIPVLS